MFALAISLVAFAFQSLSVLGQTWPASNVAVSDEMPNIELGLAPPAQPLPQVSAIIGNMDKSREEMEAAEMAKLQSAYNMEAKTAKAQIGELIGRSMRIFGGLAELKSLAPASSDIAVSKKRVSAVSFLSSHQEPIAFNDKLTVRVNVIPSAEVDPAFKARIISIEQKRVDHETSALVQAILEPGHITGVILEELDRQIQSHVNALLGKASASQTQSHAGRSDTPANIVGFMETRQQFHKSLIGLPKQTNVRVVASEVPYPSVGSLVQDMETRRDISERLGKARILSLAMDLLKAERAFAKEALTKAIDRILSQSESMLAAHSVN